MRAENARESASDVASWSSGRRPAQAVPSELETEPRHARLHRTGCRTAIILTTPERENASGEPRSSVSAA